MGREDNSSPPKKCNARLKACGGAILDQARGQIQHRDKRGQKEAIHRLRVAMKQMRALLRLLKPHLSGKQYARLNEDCRTLSNDLASNRDSDVVLETLELLAADSKGAPAYLHLYEALKLEGDDACLPGDKQTPGWRKIEQVLDRVDWQFAQLPLKGVHKRDLHKGVERGFRKGRKLWRRAQKRSDSETLHDWRKVVKSTLYQKQLLRRSDSSGNLLRSLGRRLGELHDLDVLEQHLQQRRRWVWQEDLQWLAPRLHWRRERLLGQAYQCAAQIYVN
ncbi:hypothetical protein GCM10011352_41680 [Marinobacterium zhoushanense]|uniref:CHAD domain-containing protein n=1 Tax=Marinobacterium zhoushanense TaxID=1679163 RepID=A0ABQ1KZS7_9GAMM|nr:CHAD domain-containing protein [Marinobacterium zhoushanense]GGC10846.1 hypothetical protein GCM10011352_41680 [Marinobacterium zhoushanense]